MATDESGGGKPEIDPRLAELILELANDGLLPGEELAPEPVVLRLLTPAASLAATLLVEHGRHCSRPKTCLETPGVLRKYLTMRPQVILREVPAVARALVDHPEHSFTRNARAVWLDRLKADVDAGDDLEGRIATGLLFTTSGLREYLADAPRSQAKLLASTLWARNLPNARERALFRLLGPLGGTSESGANEGQPTPIAPTGRPSNALKKPREERREIEGLQDELRMLKRERRRLTEQLAREAANREATAAELAEALKDAGDLRAEIEALQRDMRVTNAKAEIAERDRTRAASTSEQLRAERDAAAGERAELELARSRLAGGLAQKNRQLELLRTKLAAIPTGAEAVHMFLSEEDARIDQELQIAQGGDRRRADAEHAAHRRLERAFLDAFPEFVQARPAAVVRRADLSIEPLGGADEVGRSAYLIRVDDRTVLVDCGIKVGKKHLEEIAPLLERAGMIDAVVLTHAHTDHIGWLPAVVHRFPDVPVYCTIPTAELAPIMLGDCHRHHLVTMARLREERLHSSAAEPIDDPYDPEDIHNAVVRLIGCAWDDPVTVPFANLQFTFMPAGHILGAASVLIEGPGRRVLMSGDISTENQYTVGRADWSGCSGEVDLLVLESTYGGEPRGPLIESQAALVGFTRQTLDRGGSIILPCFGLGRGQEVEALLAAAMHSGDLPKVTVWVDGMIRDINGIYADHQPAFRLSENFTVVSNPSERMYVIEEARRQPTIIVSTSGMLAGGPAVEYARHLLPDAKNRIAFTGYQDEGSPGNELLSLTAQGLAVRTVTVADEEGKPVEIRAAAQAKHFGLSAHADQRGLVESASSVAAKNVLLVHGFPRTQEPLRAILQRRMPRAEIVLGATRSYRIS
jgi:Cft2 family RNA processing exonuclease